MLRPSPFLPALAALAALAAPALAAPGDSLPPPAPVGVATYALIVGSNPGGPGQVELRYAEDDARRVGALLTELGGYAAGNIDIVVHPTPGALRDRLTALSARINADVAAGRQARVFFYYSGHARAEAIDLGDDELPLAELRQRLFQIPATLTVVVLDACQSGAFSRIKGAAPAADFSFNSRQRLDASGIAVLASSSGSELSQESEQLRSSYFTHHLLVGLRGAGDVNHDGEVSIDEAYQYAYHQTLLATAETAVGGQHVTFEADLKGHGEVALSFPRAATAVIVLPAALEGQTLIEDRHAHTVVAETYKAKGTAVRIAVAPGEYDVLVRHGSTLSRCEVGGGGTGDLELGNCRDEAITVGVRKGGGFARPTRIELTALIGAEREDGYTRTLGNFGYTEDGLTPATGLQLSVLRRLSEHVWVGGLASNAQAPGWSRPTDGLAPLRIDWNTTTIAAAGRYEQPMSDHGWFTHLLLYGQATAGLGIGRTHFADQDNATMSATYYGPAFSLGAGLLLKSPALDGLGLALGYQLDYAPVIDNLVGDTHASGGSRLSFGLSYAY